MASSDHTPPENLPSEVFLDTSIHLARLRSPAFQRRIDETLEHFARKGTSSYAKVEYGNNVLSVAAYLLDKLEKLGDLEALADHINNRLVPEYRDHRKKQLWFFNLLRKHFNRPEATERAKLELRRLLRIGTDRVSSLCDETRDGIACPHADQRGCRRWRRPQYCQDAHPRCRISEFFTENRALFCRIRDAILNEPVDARTAELDRFAGIIDQACKKPEILRDVQYCLGLADAIISVDSQNYRSFFTENIKESRVLCRTLSQLLLYLKQDPMEAVEYLEFRASSPLPEDHGSSCEQA